MITSNHVFYIPLIFALGIFIGAYFGRRAAFRSVAEAEREEREREQRRKDRKRAKAPAETPKSDV